MPLSPSSMASSIPQYYSNYTFTTTSDLADYFPTTPASSLNCSSNSNNNNSYIASSILDNFAMWGGSVQDHHHHHGFNINNNNNNNNHLVIDNGALDHVVSLDCDTMSSANWMPNNFGVSSDFVVPAISDCKMGMYGGSITGFQSLISNSRYHHQPHVGEFSEECCGFVEDIKPPASYPNAATENWGIQGNQMAAVEEPNIKVGRYSEEERKERILRYLKKRNQRNFNKTIKYACRKTLADRRVRVRGRFARNNELCEEDHHMATKKHENHHLKEEFYGGDDSIQFQLKNDDEDWLQEAMASLVYLSQSSPEDM